MHSTGVSPKAYKSKAVFDTFLDPLADKFLLVTSFILFSMNGWLPKWPTITIYKRGYYR